MIVRTGLINVTVEHEDSEFYMTELSTKDEADAAVSGIKSPGAAVRETFIKGITGWKNVNDADGPLECNIKNKFAVFNANSTLVEDVLKKFIEAVTLKKEEEKKILQNGQPGTAAPTASPVKSAGC